MRKSLLCVPVICAASMFCVVPCYKGIVNNNKTEQTHIYMKEPMDLFVLDKEIEQALNDYKERTEKEEAIKKIENSEYFNAWATTSVNIREMPSTKAKVLDVLEFNEKIVCTKYEDGDWVRIKYNNTYAFVSKKYLSDKKCKYRDYEVPYNNGFKSFMPYQTITSVSSPQYKMQRDCAYTGDYGIRQVDGRYCVAVGSYYTERIGQCFDLILENGTVIPCVLADQKANKDTDSSNRMTVSNGCVSEFVVDSSSLNSSAKKHGDISACCDEWNSPVETIRIYEKYLY